MMKKIFLIFPLIGLLSCDNSSEQVESTNSTSNYLRAAYANELIGDFDASISITNSRSMSALEDDTTNSVMTIGSTFEQYGNVGTISLNNVTLDNKYSKFYDVNDFAAMHTDISNLYGQTTRLLNTNCSGSDFCNMDFTFTMPSRLELDFQGISNNVVTPSSSIKISWNYDGDPDDLMALLVTKANDLAVGTPVPQYLVKFKNSDRDITVLGSDLSSIFSDNDELIFSVIRGNQNIYDLPSGKTVEIIASDIVSYAKPVFDK